MEIAALSIILISICCWPVFLGTGNHLINGLKQFPFVVRYNCNKERRRENKITEMATSSIFLNGFIYLYIELHEIYRTMDFNFRNCYLKTKQKSRFLKVRPFGVLHAINAKTWKTFFFHNRNENEPATHTQIHCQIANCMN